MKNLTRKILAIAALFLVLGPSLYAGMDDRLDTLEKEMKEVAVRNPQGTLGAGFTSAQVEVQNPTNLFLTFDLLYWHTKVGGTEYAYSIKNIVPSSFPLINRPPIEGDSKDNDFGWDLGIKVGAGFKSSHDDWDLYLNYTWYSENDSTSSTKPAPAALVPLKSFVNFLAQKAKSHYDIDYNDLYLELGRSYFMSSQLSVRPSFGVKSSWIDLNQHVTYTVSDVLPPPNSFIGLDVKTKDDLKLWGIGPQVGINTKLYLGYGFNLFGDGAASILYGYFKASHKEVGPANFIPHGIDNEDIIKLKHTFHRYIPFAKLALGLAYNRFVNQEKQHLMCKVGYEVQYYWRVNQIQQPIDFDLTQGNNSNVRAQFITPSEDVMFYGITGEIRLDF